MNQDVTDYIAKIERPWQADICQRIREIIFQTIPNVEERLQYSKPHYLRNKKYDCVLGTAKGWVSFTIFNAETLTPPEGLFESSEKGDRKTIKILEDQTVDYDLLASLLKQAAGT